MNMAPTGHTVYSRNPSATEKCRNAQKEAKSFPYARNSDDNI
jgi:hypothetical protein